MYGAPMANRTPSTAPMHRPCRARLGRTVRAISRAVLEVEQDEGFDLPLGVLLELDALLFSAFVDEAGVVNVDAAVNECDFGLAGADVGVAGSAA